jgi:hypothetical protein
MNMGHLCKAQGKYAEAEPFYKRSLTIAEKSFGPDHPSVAVLLGHMAKIYTKMGNKKEAAKCEERAKRIQSSKEAR